MQINSINDIIKLVENGTLENDELFSIVLEKSLNLYCFSSEPISKETKLKYLKEWKYKWSILEDKPLFFLEYV